MSVFAVLLSAGVVSAAQPDATNYCRPPPSPSSPPYLEALSPAYDIARAKVRSATGNRFRAGQVLADLELAPTPGRRLVDPSGALGLSADVQLSAMRLPSERFVADFLFYCARGGDLTFDRWNPRQEAAGDEPGICFKDYPSDGSAETAYPARLRDLPLDPSQWHGGKVHFGGAIAVDHALVESAHDATFRTTLTIEDVKTSERPAFSIWHRPAFKELTVTFAVDGVETFSRRLYDPIGVGDDWLIVTDLTETGDLTIERMSNAQWSAFKAIRCPG